MFRYKRFKRFPKRRFKYYKTIRYGQKSPYDTYKLKSNRNSRYNRKKRERDILARTDDMIKLYGLDSYIYGVDYK